MALGSGGVKAACLLLGGAVCRHPSTNAYRMVGRGRAGPEVNKLEEEF